MLLNLSAADNFVSSHFNVSFAIPGLSDEDEILAPKQVNLFQEVIRPRSADCQDTDLSHTISRGYVFCF